MSLKTNRLEFLRPLRKKSKFPRAVMIFVSGLSALGLAVAIFVGVKLRGDPEVMDDIDRHFADLDKYAPEPREYSEPSGAGPEEGGEARLVSQGGKPADFAGHGWRSSGFVKSRRPQGSPQYSRPAERKRALEPESRWEGILQIAPGTYSVDEALIEKARKNPGQFAGNARTSVAKIDDEPAGFRLGGIREGDAIRALGLKNGDIITAVNGHQLKNVDDALAAVASLRFSDKYRLDVIRGNQKLLLYYRVE